MRNESQNDLTIQSLIDKLRAIIELEMQKPLEQIDDTLVCECSDFLMELEEKESFSDTEVKKRVALIFGDGSVKTKKSRGFRALIAAACIVIFLLVANLVAYALGYDPYEACKQLGRQIIEMLPGEKSVVGNSTIEKLESKCMYDSLDDFIQSGDYDVLYPAYVPEGVSVGPIHCYIFNNEISLTFFSKINAYDDTKEFYSYIVNVNAQLSEDELMHTTETKEINGITCYLYAPHDLYQCRFEYQGNEYFIQTDNYDELIKIVENLEET